MNTNEEIKKHWAKHGDKIKFKDLETASYDMIRGNLTRYAYGRLKDWMDAEDAVQDAYEHALRYPPQGDGHNFSGLFKLWLDQAIADIKSKKHNKSLVEEEESDIEDENMSLDKHESTDLFPDQAVDIVGQTDLIMDMSDRLKTKQKHIVRLALIFGYSYKEIMKILKVDFKYIDNTLSYFRQKVKENPRYENLCR